jgi:Flp pilus assembly protein TadD
MGPDLAAAERLFLEGSECLKAKDYSGAEALLRRAIQRSPDLAEAHANLGVVLEHTGTPGEAASCYARALALDPGCLEAHLNLGVLLVNQKRFEEARAVYDRAVRLHPESPAVWSNLGVLHACLKRDEEAERCCRRALSLDQTYTKARFNLSYVLLRQGRFEEGWAALEARPWNQDLLARIPGPRWQGEGLNGKSLLIGTEAGHGDMIQFCRYAPLLKGQGAARIGIVCQPALKRLFATLPGVDAVVALGEIIPDLGWDFWTLPYSIPRHCGTRLESIPAPIPYLFPIPEEALAWRSRIPAGGVRVGLVWKGNPQFENDGDRSLPGLEALAPLAAVGHIRFVSLQTGAGEEEAAHPPAGMTLFQASPWIVDFADTAALMANLDLVISVDTAAAHLAGALGRPCWVLLPHHKTDWRWLEGREDSPWYPVGMRLFRQSDRGGWVPVIEAVTAALRQFVQQRRAEPSPP